MSAQFKQIVPARVLVLLLFTQVPSGGGQQFGCFPLQDPWWSDGRFDLSSCAGILTGDSPAVDCANGYTRIGGTQSCTCTAPYQPVVSTWPVCVRAAAAPTAPVVLSRTATTLTISWQDQGLRDCGAGSFALTFSSWGVEYKIDSGAWTAASGECASLSCSDMTTQCTLTGLTGNSLYHLRVKASCSNAAVDSAWSEEGTGNTAPTAAGAPTNLQATVQAATSITFSWDAGSQGDCTFESYQVELRDINGIWFPSPAGCQDLRAGGSAQCQLVNLKCDSHYQIRVKQLCTDALTNSPLSAVLSATSQDANCPVKAASPPSHHSYAEDGLAMVLNWHDGQPNGCAFSRWELLMQGRIGTEETAWQEVSGCDDLNIRSVSTCTVFGLTQPEYRYFVREICHDPRANSGASMPSPWQARLLRPADAPTSVTLSNASQSTLKLTWIAGEAHDCLFAKYSVRISTFVVTLASSDAFWTADPPGCSLNIDKDVTECELQNLNANFFYTAGVRVHCIRDSAASGWAISDMTATLPLQAPLVTGISVSQISASGARLQWNIGMASPGCNFARWQIEAKLKGTRVWFETDFSEASRALVQTRFNSGVEIQSLSCGSKYILRLREVCEIPAATGPYGYSDPFTTLGIGDACDARATPPSDIVAQYPTASSLFVTFKPGLPGACSFSHFEVQHMKSGTTDWVSLFLGDCAAISPRESPTCSARGLVESTDYWFRVREVCTTVTLNSQWVTTSKPARTLAAVSLQILEKMPRGIVNSVPSHMYLVFSEPVMVASNHWTVSSWATGCYGDVSNVSAWAKLSDPEFRQAVYQTCTRVADQTAFVFEVLDCCGQESCEPICSFQEPSSSLLEVCPAIDDARCGCLGLDCAEMCWTLQLDGSSEGLTLLSDNQVVQHQFPYGIPKAGCQYTVTMPKAFVRTRAVPARFIPAMSWTFKYLPAAPRLVSLVTATATMTTLTVAATWTVACIFTCTTSPGGAISTDGVFGGGMASSTVFFENLAPGSAFELTCFATETEVFVVQGTESRCCFRTQQDTNARLSALQVSIETMCSAGTPAATDMASLSPTFNAEASGQAYTVVADISGYRSTCGLDASADVQAFYRVSVLATPASQFATVTHDPPTATRPFMLHWAGNEIPTVSLNQVINTIVTPHYGGQMAAAHYPLNVIATYASLQIQTVTTSPEYALPTDGTGSVTVQCIMAAALVSSMPLVHMKIKIGSLIQATTLGEESDVTVNGVASKQFFLHTTSALAYGFGLPVIVAHLHQEFISSYSVSFMGPVLSSMAIYVNGQQKTYASVLTNTEIRVHGSNFGSGSGAEGARIRVSTVPSMVTDILYLKIGGTTNFNGDHSVIQAGYPLLNVNAARYNTVCDRSKPMWHKKLLGAFCWVATDSRWKYVFFASLTEATPTIAAEFTPPGGTYSPNPIGSDLHSGAAELSDGTEGLHKHQSYRLTLVGASAGDSGTYVLILPEHIMWYDHASQYSSCSSSKHRWATFSAVLCWSSGAWRLLQSSGDAATELGKIECSGYNPLPHKCSAPTGSLTSIQAGSARRLQDAMRITSAPANDTRRTASLVEEESFGLDRAPARKLSTASSPNLCVSQTYISNFELRCSFSPAVQARLYVELEIFSAIAGTYRGAWLVDPWGHGSELLTQYPTVTSINPPEQEWSSYSSITITGNNFPSNLLTTGNIQLWASALSTPPGQVPNSFDYFPMCLGTTRTSEMTMVCSRTPGLNNTILKTTKPNLWLQVSETIFSPMASNLITIPNFNVSRVTRDTDFELTPVRFTLEGTEFGLPTWNSEVVITIVSQGRNTKYLNAPINASEGTPENVTRSCKVTFHGKQRIDCIVNDEDGDTLFGKTFEEQAYNHSAPYHQYPFELVLQHVNNSDETVLARFEYRQLLYVELFRCEAGKYRMDRKTNKCKKCEKGFAKPNESSELACYGCPKGFFQSRRGKDSCTECAPANFTTKEAESTARVACICAEGYYRNKRFRGQGPWGTGQCLECPVGAKCDGRNTRPYSREGFWSPGRELFLPCSPPEVCLEGTYKRRNKCSKDRNQISKMCTMCAEAHFRYRGGCSPCTSVSYATAHIAPLVLLFCLVCIAVPCHLREHSRKHLVLKLLDEREEEMEAQGTFRDEEQEKRVADAKARGMRNAEVKKKKKKFRTDCCDVLASCLNPCKICHKLIPVKWLPQVLQESVTQPRLRMVMLVFSKFQLMWALYLMPFDWPELLKVQSEWFSIFVFDLDRIRPECAAKLEYHQKFIIQWMAPLATTFIMFLGIRVHGCIHRDTKSPKYVHFSSAFRDAVSTQACLQLMSHFADDLVIFQCSPCQGGDIQCLDDYNNMECNMLDPVYKFIAYSSLIDIGLIICPVIVYVFWALYKSWYWQHGQGNGVDKYGNLPWHIWVSDFWVKGYKGFAGDLREEAIHLGDYLRPLIREGKLSKLHDIWDTCVFMVKVNRWHQTEKLVETLIIKIIESSMKRRQIRDQFSLGDEEEILNCRSLCSRLCRKKKRKPKSGSSAFKIKGLGLLSCCKCCLMCCKYCCKCLKLCCLMDLPKRPLPRHKRPNPYLQEDFLNPKVARRAQQEPRQVVMGQKQIRTKAYREMTLQDHANEAAIIEREQLTMRIEEQEVQKRHDLHQLMHLLAITDEFIREVEDAGGILNSRSIFWCYAWEFLLMLQKMLTVLICSFAPPEKAQQVMSACMFFQIIILIMCVDLEPFEWNVLNDVEVLMDLLMLYMVILTQLNRTATLQLVSTAMIMISVTPLTLRMLLPELKPGDVLDEEGHVVHQPKKAHHIIELAVFAETLGASGMRKLRRAQRRLKQRYVKKHGTQEQREEVATEIVKEKKKKQEVLEPTLRERILKLPKTLIGPVEAVAKVGWSKISWPSNFTAVHLAANAGHSEAIKILYELGAALTTVDQWDLMPIDYAEQGGFDECVKTIKELAPNALAYRSPTRARAAKATKQITSSNLSNIAAEDAAPAPDKIGQPVEDSEGESQPLFANTASSSVEPPPQVQRGNRSGKSRSRAAGGQQNSERAVVTGKGNMNVRGHVLKKGKQLPEHMAQRMTVWNEHGVQELMHKEVHGYDPEPESLFKQPSRTVDSSGGPSKRRARTASGRDRPALSAPLMN